MRRKLVIGNWKMNGSRAANTALLSGIVAGLNDFGADCAVCSGALPGAVQASWQARPVAWGAQDVSAHASGAYTGEVSAAMLVDFG
jgi:triosephosphate isomerase